MDETDEHSPDPLRILYSFPHALGSPGIGTTAWHQVNQLVAKGHQVSLVAGSIAKPVVGLDVSVETMVAAGQRIPRRAIGLNFSMVYHDLRARYLLNNAHGRYQVVHTWPLSGERTLQAAAHLGIPGVREAPNTHTAHAYRIVEREMKTLGLVLSADNPHRFHARRLATEMREWTKATGILVPSEAVASTFRRAGFPESALLKHRYGYDPSEFRPVDAPRAPGGLRAVFVGRCEPRKGLHFALRAWHASAASENGEFTIYGSFSPGYREDLAPLLNHRSVRVVGFTGEIAGAYSRADVLLLPSVEEGSALVTYEATAMGCIPLVSDAAGAYLTHGLDGFVHPAGTEDELASQLSLLSREPARVASMRAAALRNSADLTWSDAVDQLVEAYRSAIARKAETEPPGAVHDPADQDGHGTARKGVSVVICTRDRPEMLRHALRSIQQFTDPSVDVLVVDSASTGATTRAAADQAGARYVRACRPGLSIARNVGLHEAWGDVVVFTDDDCEVSTGWLDPLVRHFADPAVGAVSGQMLDPGTQAEQTGARARHFTRTVQGLDAGHGALMAFDRRALLDLGGFDDVLGAGRKMAGAEDLDMFIRTLRAGWTIIHEPMAWVVHLNQRQGSDYPKLLRGYGLGLGAMVQKFVRVDASLGLALGVRVTYRATARFIRNSVRTKGLSRPDWAMLAGIVEGFARTLRLQVSDGRFIDSSPPAHVPAQEQVDVCAWPIEETA